MSKLSMVSVTDINGVGPAKAETLEEEGYDSVEAIAEADKDKLAGVDGVGDDRALEFIVQAQDLVGDEDEDEQEGEEFDLKPAEVSDEIEEMEQEPEEDEEEVESEPELKDDGVDEEEEEEDEPEPEEETFIVSLDFSSQLEYDVYHAALMREYESVYTSDQPKADTIQKALDNLDDFESVTYELDRAELNNLHSAILQQRTNYQGANHIEQADALKEIERQINEQRDEYLF